MTRRKLSFVLALMLSTSIVHTVAAQERQQSSGARASSEEHHGSMGDADFDAFHDRLHPLQHDALPQNDFARIRRDARDLVLAGRRITRRDAPAALTSDSDVAKFCDEQARFADALKRFDRAAQRNDDRELKRSFSAVHDTFEELAYLVRRR